MTHSIFQKKNKPWILIDLEEMLQKLKSYVFIKEDIFKKTYTAQKDK